MAFACVAILILTGEYQAWRQIDPLAALWSTAYGITLCAKLALFTVMVALVGWLRRGRRHEPPARRIVAAETVLGAVILLVTTALTAQPPARSVYGPAITLKAPLERSDRADISMSTTRHGPVAISVSLTGEAPQEVSGVLSSDEAQIASLPVHLAAKDPMTWVSGYTSVPRPGRWTLQLTVQYTVSNAVATAASFQVW